MAIFIEGGTGGMLASLRNNTNIQPVSNPSKAKEVVEESKIQPAETQPVIVERESDFERYEHNFDINEVNEGALQALRDSNVTMKEVTKFQDLDYKSDAVRTVNTVKDTWDVVHNSENPGRAVTDPSIAESLDTVSVMVQPQHTKTVSDNVEEMVEKATFSPTKNQPTVDEVIAHGTTVQRVAEEGQIRDFETTPPPEYGPTTQFEAYQEAPIHTQSTVELHETLEATESPILRPEQDDMMDPPERPLVREKSMVEESVQQPTVSPPTPEEEKIEEAFQQGVQESLQVKAQRQSEILTSPASDMPDTAEIQQQSQAAAVVTPAVSPAPSPVTDTNTASSVEAVEGVSAVPEVEAVPVPVVEPSVAVAEEEPEAEVRGELQSSTELHNATPAPREELPEPVESTPIPVETAPIPQETAPIPVESSPAPVEATPAPVEVAPVESTPVPVEVAEVENPLAEEAALEPLMVGGGGEEVSLEEFFPPLPGASGGGEETQEAVDYFPPLPGSGESTSQEAIERVAAQEVTAELRNPVEFTENPEVETYVQENYTNEGPTTISREQMAYLRTMNPQYAPVEEEDRLVEKAAEEARTEESNLAEEAWVSDAMHSSINARYQVNIGQGQADVSRFEEVYVPEELSSLADYEYELDAERVDINRETESKEENNQRNPLEFFGA